MSVIKKKNWDDKIVLSKIDGLLSKFDDGELFVEEVFSENILFDENKVKNASYDQDRGFGLRTVKGDAINFFHSSELNEGILASFLINNSPKFCLTNSPTLNCL